MHKKEYASTIKYYYAQKDFKHFAEDLHYTFD